MTAPTVTELLPKVRRWVLERRASLDQKTSTYGTFGLSQLCGAVASHTIPTVWTYMKGDVLNRSQYTSRAPKNERGLVQECLKILAREGVMYTRRKNPYLESYDRGQHDKYFWIRITQEDAIRRLRKMK
jgi:hypothetical protein